MIAAKKQNIFSIYYIYFIPDITKLLFIALTIFASQLALEYRTRFFVSIMYLMHL